MSGTNNQISQPSRFVTETVNAIKKVAPNAPMANGTASNTNSPDVGNDVAHTNGVRPAPAPPVAAHSKKGRPKKAPEPTDTSKLVAARIAALELDQAGDKEQEAEIGE